MGVRFYDKENMSTGDNYTTSACTNCNCNTCSQHILPSSTTTASTSANTHSSNNGNNLNIQKSGILREIVGNCKEMRIEDNSHNLRIVGNNNRIRITFNMGDITVIGNNTRLKIKINHGHLKYIGNDGRISLGKDSTEQLVDYSGCNGVLKVQNSKKSSQLNDDETKNNTSMGSTGFNGKLNFCKHKEKCTSGCLSDNEVFKCHNDYNMFDHKNSVPNITTKPYSSESVSDNSDHHIQKSVVQNFGNVIITNSSNICVSPHYTTH